MLLQVNPPKGSQRYRTSRHSASPPLQLIKNKVLKISFADSHLTVYTRCRSLLRVYTYLMHIYTLKSPWGHGWVKGLSFLKENSFRPLTTQGIIAPSLTQTCAQHQGYGWQCSEFTQHQVIALNIKSLLSSENTFMISPISLTVGLEIARKSFYPILQRCSIFPKLEVWFWMSLIYPTYPQAEERKYWLAHWYSVLLTFFC